MIIEIFGDGGGALLMICGGAARVALALVASASRCASGILCFARGVVASVSAALNLAC